LNFRGEDLSGPRTEPAAPGSPPGAAKKHHLRGAAVWRKKNLSNKLGRFSSACAAHPALGSDRLPWGRVFFLLALARCGNAKTIDIPASVLEEFEIPAHDRSLLLRRLLSRDILNPRPAG
jgi:hypothetical protein